MNDRLCITISKTLAYSLVTVQLSPDNSKWLGPDQDDVNNTFAQLSRLLTAVSNVSDKGNEMLISLGIVTHLQLTIIAAGLDFRDHDYRPPDRTVPARIVIRLRLVPIAGRRKYVSPTVRACEPVLTAETTVDVINQALFSPPQ